MLTNSLSTIKHCQQNSTRIGTNIKYARREKMKRKQNEWQNARKKNDTKSHNYNGNCNCNESLNERECVIFIFMVAMNVAATLTGL